MNIKKVFIIGAVTGVEDTIDAYDELGKVVVSVLGEVELITPNTIFDYRNDYIKTHKSASEEEINYNMVKFDLDCVRTADLVVGDLSIKSTGVGIELGTILNEGNKKLFFAKEDAVVSNMILGAFSDVGVIRYKTFDDFKQKLKEELKKL